MISLSRPQLWRVIAGRIVPRNTDFRVLLGRSLELPQFTVAELLAGTPPPDRIGPQVWCSDHAGGPRIAYSDGTAWRDLRTGNVVA